MDAHHVFLFLSNTLLGPGLTRTVVVVVVVVGVPARGVSSYLSPTDSMLHSCLTLFLYFIWAVAYSRLLHSHLCENVWVVIICE